MKNAQRTATLASMMVVFAASCGALPAAAGPDPAASSGAAPTASPEPAERWYVLTLDGKKIGWGSAVRSTDADGNIVSEDTFKMSFARGDAVVIPIDLEQEFVETPAGDPVRIESVLDMGGESPTRSIYIFNEGGDITHLSEAGGRKTRKTIPVPRGDWLTPAEVEEFVSSRFEAGADTITFASLDTTSGLAVALNKIEILDRSATVEAMGKVVPAVKATVTTSLMPGMATTSYIDEHGNDIRSDITLGAMKITMLAADKELALADFDAPELMASTLVKPDKPIADSRAVRKAEYTLRTPGSPLPDIPTTGAQRFTRTAPDAGTLSVDLDALVPVREEGLDLAPYTSPSMFADSDDPAIRDLVKQATQGIGDDPAARAHAMEDFLEKYMTEAGLDVGFATASEVCKTRAGDCSEHGVLLAAMLRADGIPSRAVSGLVYIDGFLGHEHIFGYHMWAQALLAQPGGTKAWVDLDAAMHTMDATHIILATTSLADGESINSMVAIGQAMGQLEIQVGAFE